MTKSQLRFLVVHPWLIPVGGAEKVCLHILRILRETYPDAEITLMSISPPDWTAVMEASGLNLQGAGIAIKCYPLKQFPNRRLPLMQMALLQRAARSIAQDYSLTISTFNEMNFGTRGLQYVHIPMFARRTLLARYAIAPAPRRMHLRASHGLYSFLVRKIARMDSTALSQNVTIVNSHFMKDVFAEAYGVRGRVIYPTLVPPLISTPTGNDRKFQFLSVGRIEPDKHLLDLIPIYRQIARTYPNSTFVIAGRLADGAYYNRLVTAASEVPVTFEVNVDQARLERLQRESLFYVHPKPYEHFGISILEAVRAGCIPFVHGSGGAVEIVPFQELHFRSPGDFPEKVASIIEKGRADKLRERLLRHVMDMTQKGFDDRMKTALSELLH